MVMLVMCEGSDCDIVTMISLTYCRFQDRLKLFPEIEASTEKKFGPQNVPDGFAKECESFWLFFQKPLEHILEKTNQRFREHNYRLSKKGAVLQISMQVCQTVLQMLW